jgi:hypothetical protein
MATKTKMTTDHEEIRRWVEERGGHPAEVESTERDGDVGIIRIDFPGYSGEGTLKPISWEEWFDKFDRSNLAFTYQETTARGQKSNFNKLVGRETAEARSRGETGASRRSLRGRGRAAGRATAARSRRGAGRRTGRTSTRGGSRTRKGARTGRTREAPRAAVARLTGRGRKATAGSKRSTSGRGKTARGAARGGRRTTARKTARRTSRGGGRGRRR